MTKPPDPPIVTLTTDFGLADPYVAAMKGVLLSRAPGVAIVDVSHDVRPQRIEQAVFITQSAWPYFPSGAVHVAVVDPGVGGERLAVALVTPRGFFVGPDNGVLSSALPDDVRPDLTGPTSLPDGCRAFAIMNERVLRAPVSATFHGRDVFAPAAAHLALGLPAVELGAPLDAVVALPPLRARPEPDGSLRARVVHIDRFGNAVTDARAGDLPAAGLVVEVCGQQIAGPVRTYADATGPAAIVGSAGYLEVALPGGSAAAALGIEIGDDALVRPRR